MQWIELTVRTNTAGADMVSEQLIRAGAAGTVIEDRHDAAMSLENPANWELADMSILDAMPSDVLVRAYLPDDVSALERVEGLRRMLQSLTPERIGFDAGPLDVSLANVREEDWAENWKQYYKPFKVGKRLVVRPVWEPYDCMPEELVITIDPGMAFGNGTHETTAMCLALLEDTIRPGDQVLDVGTGSGILSLASALLGAGRVLAVDIDPVAIRVAGENIASNGLEQAIEARVGDLLEGVDIRADVVVANIIADAVILLSGAAYAHLKPGGVFITSGIIRDRETDVLEALGMAGFTAERIERKGEWVAIVARP